MQSDPFAPALWTAHWSSGTPEELLHAFHQALLASYDADTFLAAATRTDASMEIYLPLLNSGWTHEAHWWEQKFTSPDGEAVLRSGHDRPV